MNIITITNFIFYNLKIYNHLKHLLNYVLFKMYLIKLKFKIILIIIKLVLKLLMGYLLNQYYSKRIKFL